MQSPTLERYFAMVQGQRESLYRRIENLPPETIWKRPASRSESGGTWSVGQSLEHINKLLRLFRWLYTAYLPIAVPIARAFFVGKPFSVEAEDFFQRDLPRPPGLAPRDRSRCPWPYARLRTSMDGEWERTRRQLEDIPEELAGHVCLWDPLTGKINMMQCLLLDYYHERRHLGFAHRLLDAWGVS